MTRLCSAAPPPKKPKAAIEELCSFPQTKGVYASRRELDRERDTVQLMADFSNDRRICISKFKAAAPSHHPLHKKLCRGKRKHLLCGKARIVGRVVQRR